MKPRFECESCGVDQETIICGYCVMKCCLSCIGKHEPDCKERHDGVKRKPGVGFVVLPLVLLAAMAIQVRAAGDNIRDFSFFPTTDDFEVYPGGVVVYNVAINELDGGKLEPITMKCTGAPPGATCTITPRVKTVKTPGDPEIIITTNPTHPPRRWQGLMYASYREEVYTPTPPGDYNLTLIGTAPTGLQHTAKLPLHVYHD